MADNNEKIKVGWFSFSCCEDNTIVMTEIMNEHWQEWRKIFDFVHARVLQSKNEMGPMDIAFVEGAIGREFQKEKLLEIRGLSTLLVAVGSCAVTGMPSAQRNMFPDETKEDIDFIVDRFGHLDEVLKLSDVVKVDAEIPGCPMSEQNFLDTLDTVLNQIKEMKAKEE